MKGIKIAVDYFVSRGHKKVFALVPQWRRRMGVGNIITNQELLEKLHEDGYVQFTPSRRVGNIKTIVPYDDR